MFINCFSKEKKGCRECGIGMLNPSEVKRRWFTPVSRKLGRVSVMMRRRDQLRILGTAKREEVEFQFSRWEMEGDRIEISCTTRGAIIEVHIARSEMR